MTARYLLSNTELDRVEQIKDLGVVMDASLSFDEQLKSVINKCLRILGFIRNVTIDFSNPFTIIYLYKTLLLPIVTYSIPIWCTKTEKDLK